MVLVGDTSVGKSCLIHNYIYNTFSDEYEPTVLDVYKGTKNFKNKQIQVEIHDTSGDDLFGINRTIKYRGADVFMICVAVNNQTSLQNVKKWKDEIKSVVPEAPIMLTLTKNDLAEFLEDSITKEQINQAKRQHGLQAIAITSSKEFEDHNVHKAFEKLIQTGYSGKYE